jgi:thymidine kinase
MATIKLITGPMYSGKSSRLLQLILRDYAQNYYHYLFIRPEMDTRGFITRDKQTEKRFENSRHNIEYLTVGSFTELLELDLDSYRTIFIDELHLFGSDDAYLFFQKVLKSEASLTASALNGSSEQESFETVSVFLPFVTDIEFLKTRCYNADDDSEHDEAAYTKWIARKTKKNLIEIGDSSYTPACRKCLKL